MGVTYQLLSELLVASIDLACSPERIPDGKLFFSQQRDAPFWLHLRELNSSQEAASCWLHARDVIAKVAPPGQFDQISRTVETLMSRVGCQLGNTVVKRITLLTWIRGIIPPYECPVRPGESRYRPSSSELPAPGASFFLVDGQGWWILT